MRLIDVLGTLLLIHGFSLQAAAEEKKDLARGLVFHASFDQSVDADFARGDPKLYTAESIKRQKIRSGVHTSAVRRMEKGGRFGGCLSFQKRTNEIVFFKGGRNVAFSKSGFDGTISMWMKVSPKGLPPGFVDPLQITDKTWNDRSIFLDFSKDSPRHFRMGFFADHSFWNPGNRKWEDIPENERPMVDTHPKPFPDDRWTHVAITYSDVNAKKVERSKQDRVSSSDRSAQQVVLYVDGESVGEIVGPQRVSWEPERVVMMLGIYYVGQIDELALFDRNLSAKEIIRLRDLPEGIKPLR